MNRNVGNIPHSPPSRLSSTEDVCGGRAASPSTAPTPTVPGLAGSGTASFLGLSPCCTLHLPPPPPCTPHTPPPPPPPQLTPTPPPPHGTSTPNDCTPPSLDGHAP